MQNRNKAIMTENKKIVEQYMEGFNASDHSKILSCLTDDIHWEMPGLFSLTGKQAFDKEIENDAFVGRPDITVIRIVEENNIVIAEGAVQAARKDGGLLNALFCDVFEMQDGKIKRLTTYLMDKAK